MSNGTPQNEQNDRNESGLDKGTGDPNDDRAYMMDEPPAKVEPAEEQLSEEQRSRDQND